MSCSKCQKKGPNKRKCLREPTTTGPSQDNDAGPSSALTGRGRGKPKSKEKNVAAPIGRGRGRPKGSTEKNVAARRIVDMIAFKTDFGQL
ncbi:hypothetical protein K7X08_002785 [Anisodus acutangulus]|uniref:Uncharacterized protein n=1 Tax=Anisodus acutangulus TaxID=402998 RepID=A0A9Q1RI33_9SOLA|nr:hypothetical protein K7X08_002785 [Anisodus acutangulus]